MPEGDSLVRLVHRLQPVMVDQVLHHTDFRVPTLATVELAGWRVRHVAARAKYLLFTVESPDPGKAGQQLVVLSHLGMDGSWSIDTRPTQATRCVLEFAEHSVVGSALAKLQVHTPDAAAEALAFLGPDLLAPDWQDPGHSEVLLRDAIANFRAATDQPIATALLDQRLVSGIGNIYRCETLLLAGLNPHRLVSELSDDQLVGLIQLARNLLVLNVPPGSASRTRRRTTDVRPDAAAPFGVRVATPLEQARAQADRRYNPPYWVYRRERQGCLKCGGPIRYEQLGTRADQERDLWWCPNCQHG